MFTRLQLKRWRNRVYRTGARLAIPIVRKSGGQTRPEGYFPCVVEWSRSDYRGAEESYEEFEPPMRVERPIPQRLFDSPLGDCFRSLKTGSTTRQFRLRLEGARVYGMAGVVVHRSNRIFSELTFEYGMQPQHFSFWNRVRIPAVSGRGERVGVAHSMSCENYSHWVLEVVPQLIRLKEDLKQGEIDRIYVRYEKPFQKEWMELIGIDEEAIIPAKDSTHLEVDRMIVYSMPMRDCVYTPKQISLFRRLVRDDWRVKTGRKLFIGREGGNRSFSLEDADLREVVADCGFEYVLMEKFSVPEKIRLCAEASVIAGPHGAGLGGIVFVDSSAELREIHSPIVPNLCYFRMARAIGLTYDGTLGRAVAPGQSSPRCKKVHRPVVLAEDELRGFLVRELPEDEQN